ncbi:hypothetical protein NADFUDRAFT_66395 [Nadsonia fulvescens var. elongata DSM 6958]|uniref:Uncharacterized protein n=1 Tax=Nadsonia fulvescens var. elongata DSM 6958 TaxID=857566 RepID=A0A1E3PJC4_9ASCO|nr:hypothetical protein NADFUDRAFT_66395 [Nadsonia fulvescens var. elongata DSM 6958]
MNILSPEPRIANFNQRCKAIQACEKCHCRKKKCDRLFPAVPDVNLPVINALLASSPAHTLASGESISSKTEVTTDEKHASLNIEAMNITPNDDIDSLEADFGILSLYPSASGAKQNGYKPYLGPFSGLYFAKLTRAAPSGYVSANDHFSGRFRTIRKTTPKCLQQ